ncbi:MAG TPA: hypothetical protein VF294_15635 [Polyangiaceae bacterium]
MTGMRWVLAAWVLAACGGKSVIDGSAGSPSVGGTSSGGASSVGGTSSGGSTTCLNTGEVGPPLPLVFVFDSNQPLWLRRNCGIEHVLAKVCGDGTVPIQTQSFCKPDCDPPSDGCKCDDCPLEAVQVGQFGPGGTIAEPWTGYVYANGSSSERTAARTGTYAITVSAYLTSEDALARKNAYPFSTSFEYPPPSGAVHVPLEFTGI